MNKPIDQYQIGDELFRYVEGGGFFRYKVIGRRERESEVQLEVESQTCTHGWKCQLLLAQDDYGHIVHVHMLNDDEEHSQRYWHTNDGHFFCDTLEQCRAARYKKLIEEREELLRKAKERVQALEKDLADIKSLQAEVQQ